MAKNDETLTVVDTEKDNAINKNNQMYDQMIKQSDIFYQKQIDAVDDFADKQTQLQQQQTDFAIQKIEQEKEQTKKDYLKEQSAAYADWQKQSNPYSVNAEQMASMGLTNSGYSESSKVSMYNTYQNRVATARDSFNRAILNYNNAITEARLQNDALLAEIAFNALQQQLELSLQGFQYKNNLIIEKANKNLEIESNYEQVLDLLTEDEFTEDDEPGIFVTPETSTTSNRSTQKMTLDEKKIQQQERKKEKSKAIAKTSSITSYADAQKLLESLGIKASVSDSKTWSKAKRMGDLPERYKELSSYREYLQVYCAWVIDEYFEKNYGV